MDNLKSFTLYNQRLNKLIKSYQSKNPYTLQSLEATLSKKVDNSPKITENVNSPSKIVYINTQFDAGINRSPTMYRLNTQPHSISKVIMNYSFEKHKKDQLLPFLRGKRNKTKINTSDMNMSTGFQTKSQSCKILIQENIGKILTTQDERHNFIFNRDDPKIRKPFTPIKISLKYRKNFEKKVDGKFDFQYYEPKHPIMGKWT